MEDVTTATFAVLLSREKRRAEMVIGGRCVPVCHWCGDLILDVPVVNVRLGMAFHCECADIGCLAAKMLEMNQV